METENRTNSLPEPPFAGRTAVYERLQQHITQPTTRAAFTLTGWHGTGKTRLLTHFNHVFGNTIFGVYVALDTIDFWVDAEDLLQALIARTTGLLAAYDFNLGRLPDITTRMDLSQRQQWLAEDYLPAVMRIIRPHRRLVWLLDDAPYCAQAPIAATLSAYLHDLLQEYDQLSIVWTADLAQEANLSALEPLYAPALTERIRHFTHDETCEYVYQYTPICDAVHTMTGGEPRILASITATVDLNAPQLRKALQATYGDFRMIFDEFWQPLAQEERLILVVLANLYYDDPLHEKISIQRIEQWLVESDFPLDSTTIHAALRSLEYRELVTLHREGVALSIGLMQPWLLEKQQGEQIQLRDSDNSPSSVRWGWLIALAIVGMVLLALSIWQFNSPNPTTETPPPTVTLAAAPD